METYSQLGQDLKVLDFYKFKQDGYFIEIGAHNGVYLSNTYLLEKNYNWKGICIEPLPDTYQKLVHNRSSSICINKALFHTAGLSVPFNACDAASGITEKINCHFEVLDYPQIFVETDTLNNVLEQSNAPKFIEYLSIDTEGSEYDILSNVDFAKYTFGLIHVEHNYVEPNRTNIKNLLESKNYHYEGENHWDDIYIHNSLL